MLTGICSGFNAISFGKKKSTGSKRNYTAEEKQLRREINATAMSKGWKDIYTGRKFTETNPSSVEHIIPFVRRKTRVLPEEFKINGLENLVPAGKIGNNNRGNDEFTRVILEQPVILDRLLVEMENYKKVNTPLINGKEWEKGVRETLLTEIEGMYSDLSTRKLSIRK